MPYLEESLKEAEKDNLKKLIEDYIDENEYEVNRLKSLEKELKINRLQKRSFKLQDLELCRNVYNDLERKFFFKNFLKLMFFKINKN